MNNLSSYCGLVDAKIRTSDKDLPVASNSKWKMGQIFVAFSEPNFKKTYVAGEGNILAKDIKKVNKEIGHIIVPPGPCFIPTNQLY